MSTFARKLNEEVVARGDHTVVIPPTAFEAIDGLDVLSKKTGGKSGSQKRARFFKIRRIVRRAIRLSGLSKVKRLIFICHPNKNHWNWVVVDFSKSSTIFVESMKKMKKSLPNDIALVITKIKTFARIKQLGAQLAKGPNQWSHEVKLLGFQSGNSACGPYTCSLIYSFLVDNKIPKELDEEIADDYLRFWLFMFLTHPKM